MHILVAVDESPAATTVLKWVRDFPHPAGTRLTIAHVIEPFDALETLPGEPRSRVERRRADEAQTVLEEAAVALRRHYDDIKCALRQGPPIYELLTLIREIQPDVVVSGTRGLQAARGLVLGSVSQRLLSYAPCSVLLVPSKARPKVPMRVVLATDGSRGAKRAAAFVAALPGVKRIDLVSVLHPVDAREVELYREETKQSAASVRTQLRRLRQDAGREAVRQTAALLQGGGAEVASSVLIGYPVDVLPREAKRRRCDLLVVGSRGLTGKLADVLGSVSSSVAQHASCPVLVVKRPLAI